MTNDVKDNPFLQTEDYYAGYKESIEDLKNKPESMEFDKLCYMVFQTEEGKKLMESFLERFLLPGFINPHVESVSYAAVYYEGFKEAFRLLRNCVRSHQQRIDAENQKS